MELHKTSICCVCVTGRRSVYSSRERCMAGVVRDGGEGCEVRKRQTWENRAQQSVCVTRREDDDASPTDCKAQPCFGWKTEKQQTAQPGSRCRSLLAPAKLKQSQKQTVSETGQTTDQRNFGLAVANNADPGSPARAPFVSPRRPNKQGPRRGLYKANQQRDARRGDDFGA